MGPSSVGDLPPSRIVELLGNIYRYISKPTGSAGEDFAPTGIDLSSIVDNQDVTRLGKPDEKEARQTREVG